MSGARTDAEPPVRGTEPLLTVEGVSKRFGTTQALDDVSVAFAAGEVHALMGENGAGKSTLGKVIAGLVRQDSGTVSMGGVALPAGDLHAAFAAGVRIVHQELAQCPNLTVAENLCLHSMPRRGGLVDRGAMRRRAASLLAGLEPAIPPDAALGSLSPGHRQIVQIAGALDERGGAGGHGRARVIIFDEPTSSLSVAEAERLQAIIRRLAADGLAVIYVSHRMGEIFACCDRVTVLRDGRFVATSSIRAVDEGALVEQMIGRRLEPRARDPEAGVIAAEAGAGGRGAAPDAGPALEVRGLSSAAVSGITFRVAAGEVLGIGGLVGSGRSELLDAVFGIDRRARGEVSVGGRAVAMRDPRAAMRAGIGYVPEDRRLQGLFFQLGVGENIVLPEMSRLSRFGWRSLRRERGETRARMEGFRIKAGSAGAAPGSLSGGNQQKLLLARWMGSRPRVLLLDEPTRGIDVGTKAEVYRLIRAAAAAGTAVVLVSSEMPELLALSDRVMVLSAGRAAGELKGAEMTQAAVLRLATLHGTLAPLGSQAGAAAG